MRISNSNPNFRKATQKSAPMSVATNSIVQNAYNTKLQLHKMPSIAFTGFLFKSSVEVLKLPKSLKDFGGEIHSIKLFDKIKKQPIDAFIGYVPSTIASSATKHLLSVFDKTGSSIGSVGLNFSEWASCGPFAVYAPLPIAYTRLHTLENTGKNVAGVGSSLIQAAVEKSLTTEAEGKIFVYAHNFHDKPKNDPVIFYNKMGLSINQPLQKWQTNISKYTDKAKAILRMSDEEFTNHLETLTNKNIKDLTADEKIFAIYESVAKARNCGLDEISLLGYGERLFLHDDNVKKLWLPKIESNPIFNPNNRFK